MAEKVSSNTFLNSFVLKMGVKLQFGPDTQAQLVGSALKWIMPDFMVCHRPCWGMECCPWPMGWQHTGDPLFPWLTLPLLV